MGFVTDMALTMILVILILILFGDDNDRRV